MKTLKVNNSLTKAKKPSTSKVRKYPSTKGLISTEEVIKHKTEKRLDANYPRLPKWLLTGKDNGLEHSKLTLRSFYRRLKNYEKGKQAREEYEKRMAEKLENLK